MDYDNLFKGLDNLNIIDSGIKCCENECNFTQKNSIIICKKCGEIISNILEEPEWRYYGTDDTKSSDPTRCGMPINVLLPKSSVGTVISNQYSKDLNMFQVKKYQEWTSMTYKERSIYKVFNTISDVCKKSNIPKVIETEAKSLYKIISETKITRGNNRKGVIASCIYFACKNCKVARSQKEIAILFDITIPVMTKGCKIFQEIIHMSNDKSRIIKADSITPEDFIDRFCNRLNIDTKDIINIKKLSVLAQKYDISDVRPDSFAAGIILLYSKTNKKLINKKDISIISNISEVTINKCYKKIEEFMK